MYKDMEDFLDKRQMTALEKYKKESGLDKVNIPDEIKSLLEKAFLIGYDYGGIDAEEEFKAMSKIDPVGFYNWLKS